MLRDSLEGLDKVFESDIVAPKVVLVTGPPGSLKTAFCFNLVSRYLEKRNEFGLYTTLEETSESHIRNMESMGIRLTAKMQISDFTDLRELDQIQLDEEAAQDYVLMIEKMVHTIKKAQGEKFTVFVIDSLGALYSLMEDKRDMRKKMFYFFKMVRDQKLTTFVIMERAPGAESQMLGNEGFLVDGIVNLGLDRQRGKLTRYLQVEKMRTTRHSMERHALEIGKGGLVVLGPLLAV